MPEEALLAIADEVQRELVLLGRDPARFQVRVMNGAPGEVQITLDLGGRQPLFQAQVTVAGGSVREAAYRLDALAHSELEVVSGVLGSPDPDSNIGILVDPTQGPWGEVSFANGLVASIHDEDLLARYQACAQRIWGLFTEDPLGDSEAHTLVERLEGLLDRGLLIPRGIKASGPISEPKSALDRILNDESDLY